MYIEKTSLKLVPPLTPNGTDTSYSRNVIMAAFVYPSFASVSWRSGITYLLILLYLVLLQRSNVPFIMLTLLILCSDSCIACIMVIYWLHNSICILHFFYFGVAAMPCCPAHTDFVLYSHSILFFYFIRPKKMMMMMMMMMVMMMMMMVMKWCKIGPHWL